MDNLGPSQDYPDYEIPKELAPDGVEVVGDYVPISPIGGQDNTNPLAQPEADMNNKLPQEYRSIILSAIKIITK
ncbi:hypothetical protein YC2023_113103 [Brassica napus]